jgi:hypothetical protein
MSQVIRPSADSAATGSKLNEDDVADEGESTEDGAGQGGAPP